VGQVLVVGEEFGPKFDYKKGSDNVVADALSRVPTKDENVTPAMPETRSVKVDDLWTECLWALPKFDEQNRHPFQFETLQLYQSKDQNLMALPTLKPTEFQFQQFGTAQLVVRVHDVPRSLIVLSDEMLPRIVTYYHLLTNHSEGMTKLEASIRRHFWNPRLRDEIRTQLNACDICKTMKKGSSREGQLAPREVPSVPWTEVHVDCIGPWSLKVPGLKPVQVRALTMIDPVLNLVEITRTYSTKSEEITRRFVNTWLCRYPLPEKVVSDNGPEFKGAEWEFNAMDWGMTKVRISSYTPTANAIIESVHRSMGQILRTIVADKKPTTVEALNSLVDDALSQTLRACRCAANTSLQGVAPGALTFGRDMNLNIPIIADIISISNNRQFQTDLRLMRENSRRSRHEYLVGHLVFINNHHSPADKMKAAWQGPFPILQVHTNGTVTVQKGQIHERISIRHIKPSA
jgi:hypothetical protein